MGRRASEVNLKTRLSAQYTYRADGKLLALQGTFDQDRDAEYDPKDPVLTRVMYSYDALGRRVSKQIDRKCRRFGRLFSQGYLYLAEGDRILLARDGANQETLYIGGSRLNEHFAEISRREARTLVTDHLGSVLNSEAAGGVDAYGPFGEPLGAPGLFSHAASPVVYGFAGMQWDMESSLYHTKHRKYDPRVGRWLTKDPIGFAGGDGNLYRYVGNGPVNFVDATGLTAEDVMKALDYIRQNDPNFIDFSIRYTNDTSIDGTARPTMFPGDRNTIYLSIAFLQVLNKAQLSNLLNTVYHESRHIQDGFYGTLGVILSGGGDKRHEEIFLAADEFTRIHFDRFLADKYDLDVCKVK